jgi:stage V sporulation protein D (sporulation-specific penicillin-binding protein)
MISISHNLSLSMAIITTNSKAYKIGSRCRLKKPEKEEMKIKIPAAWRIYFFTFIIIAVFLSVFAKLFLVQVLAHEYYKALAEDQHSIFRNLVPKRGEIFLRDKSGTYPVAVNKQTKMAYGVPNEIENPRDAAKTLSRLLGIDEDELEKKMGKPDDMYEPIKHRLSDQEIDEINKKNIAGIHLAEEDLRYYPGGELASHVLGFVGWKDSDFGGRYGAELSFEDRLKGKAGQLFQKKDNSGRWVPTSIKEIQHAQNGDNLILTIDHIIQYETEKILKSAISRFEAERGTIIIMEVSTGKILAMANYPNFNPNDYRSVDNMEAFRNLAVSDAYECGSVFKTITMAGAIDNGKVNPDTTYTDTGSVTEAGYTIKNSDLKSNGLQTMTQVLEKSLNTGVIFAEKLMGNRNFSDYIKRFGFGEQTGIDLFGESAGNVSNLKNLKSNIQFFTAAFGQGITVTPIQLISAYNAIANGGILVKPQIVDKIAHSDGSEEDIATQEIRRVVSPSSALAVSQMLRLVVTDGHGKRANVPGYLIGGKTGTAQIANRNEKGYEEDRNIGSFVGFAPVDNPKYTILVRMDNPKNVEWAESSAAPTFGEIMKFVLEYENIEPTEKYTEKDLETFNATHTLSNDFIENKNEEQKDEDDRPDEEKRP